MASIPTRRSYPIAESKPVVEAPPAAQDWESHRGDTIIIDNGLLFSSAAKHLLLAHNY